MENTVWLWQQVVYSLEKAVFLVEGETWLIHECNPSGAVLLGYTPQELKGQSFYQLVQPASLEKLRLACQTRSWEGVHLRRSTGETFPVSLRVVPLEPENGQTPGLVIYIRDETRQTSLELANQELQQMLEVLINQSPIGFTLMDGSGKIIEWSAAQAQLSGIPSAQAIGNYLWDVRYQMLPPAERSAAMKEQIKTEIQHFLESGDFSDPGWPKKQGWPENPGQPEQQDILRPDGRMISLELIKFPISNPRGSLFAVVTTDVTERNRAFIDAKRQAKRAEILARVAAVINSQMEVEAVLQLMCEETATALGVPATTVVIADEETGMLQLAAGVGISDELRESFPVLTIQNYEQSLKEVGQVVVISDLKKEHPLTHFETFANEDIRSLLVIIMTYETQVIGSLNAFTYHETCEFSPQDIALAKAIADQAAIALVRVKSIEKMLTGREQLRALSNRMVEVVEQERRSIARELHDEIGQKLTLLKLSMDMGPGNFQHETAQEIVLQLINQVKALSLEFRPTALDDLGLLPALMMLFERYQAQTNIQVHFQHQDIDQRFPGQIETTIYRVIQEALTNVARYAQVQDVWVRIWKNMDELFFQVEDRGVGFAMQEAMQSPIHLGILGMNERLMFCGGRLDISSTPGQGTFITAVLPLP